MKLTVENTNKTIDILEKLDLNDDYVYERAILAYLQLGGIPIFMKEIPAGYSFFHARTHNIEDFFNKVSDITIPPSEYIKNFARCNRPFQPTFYCSETRPTSFMELVEYWSESRKIGESLKVTIGLWKLKRNIITIIVTTPDPDQRVSKFDIEHGRELDFFLSKYEGEELDAQKIFYQYLFEKFRKPAKHDILTYIITSAYCNVAFMRSNGSANAIYYPSVPFKCQGTNICINKSFFTPENIELQKVLRNEFTIYLNEEGKHTFVESGKIETTKIDFINNLIIWNE